MTKPSQPGRPPRYTRGERIYHAAQAMSVLFLMATGGWMLLGGPSREVRAWLARWHLAVGIGGMAVMLLLAMVTRRRVLYNMGWAVSVEIVDLQWWWRMLTFRPHKAKQLPIGRFNPGQKAELLAMPVTLLLLLGSGLAMWLQPGVLWPRHLHIAAAGLMALLLGVHLWMTLVNRATRPSLRIMWQGQPNEAWEDSHYPRAGARVKPLWIASAMWVVATVIGALVTAGGGGTMFERHFASAAMPGPLANPHAFLANNCAACHTKDAGVSAARCANCHESGVGQTVAWGKTFKAHHADTTLDCLQCHSEHRGTEEFASVLARDQWNDISCTLCHRDVDTIDARFENRLDAAHSAHYHAGVSCTSCHTSHFQSEDRVSRVSATATTCTKCHHGHENVPVDVRRIWVAQRPAVTPQTADGDFLPKAEPASMDLSCRKCHAGQAEFLAGRYEPLGLSAAADPMSGRVRCIHCHHFDEVAGRWTPATDMCATCHQGTDRDEDGRLRFAYRELGQRRVEHIQSRARALAATGDKRTLDDLYRLGPHNPSLADQLILQMEQLAPPSR